MKKIPFFVALALMCPPQSHGFILDAVSSLGGFFRRDTLLLTSLALNAVSLKAALPHLVEDSRSFKTKVQEWEKNVASLSEEKKYHLLMAFFKKDSFARPNCRWDNALDSMLSKVKEALESSRSETS